MLKEIELIHASAEPNVKERLIEIYDLIIRTAEVEESISYGMPAFKYNKKPLCYYTHYKKHIGFYPTPGPIESLEEELLPYKTSKGAVQFLHTEPLPLELIEQMIRNRMKEIDG